LHGPDHHLERLGWPVMAHATWNALPDFWSIRVQPAAQPNEPDPLRSHREPITVARLRAWLAEHPGSLNVVLSRDAEGNGYARLWQASQAYYREHEIWDGELADELKRGVSTVVVLVPAG
jgi:hypothetical protein